MKYELAPDIQKIAEEISGFFFPHIKIERVKCFRSYGTSTRRTIARCHALSKPLQLGMNRKAFYTIEVLSEKFDNMPEDERIKVIIHELMHIPFSFGGGFKHHDYVSIKNVDKLFKRYKEVNENL